MLGFPVSTFIGQAFNRYLIHPKTIGYFPRCAHSPSFVHQNHPTNSIKPGGNTSLSNLPSLLSPMPHHPHTLSLSRSNDVAILLLTWNFVPRHCAWVCVFCICHVSACSWQRGESSASRGQDLSTRVPHNPLHGSFLSFQSFSLPHNHFVAICFPIIT